MMEKSMAMPNEPPEPSTELGILAQEPIKDTLSHPDASDRYTVQWDGQDDPGDPLNTPTWRKW